MALPTYNKANRATHEERPRLPKGAYVVKIMNVKEEQNSSGVGRHLKISFDIAEGEFKDHYRKEYENDRREDKKWPMDAVYFLNIPEEDSQKFMWDNWSSFFADLEDSNNGFVFDGENLQALKGKLIGGLFHITQTEWRGSVYDHTKLRWTCVAQDIRNGKRLRLPNDKLLEDKPTSRSSEPQTDSSGFLAVPDSVDDEYLPF